MKRINIILAVIAGIILTSCDTRHFEDCPADHIFNDWGVVQYSHAFSVRTDSLFYIVNPVRNVSDSLYYNADYTDSYFHSDSTRIVMQFIPSDSLRFYIDRMYSVEVNPQKLKALVRLTSDTTSQARCELLLKKEKPDGMHYGTLSNPVFNQLLSSDSILNIQILNESTGQNYDYILYTAGFEKALQLCDSLNKRLQSLPPVKKTDEITANHDKEKDIKSKHH